MISKFHSWPISRRCTVFAWGDR